MVEGFSKLMRLPDFLGIGTQKGGTTYLHGLLQQHPQVYLAHPKELHFFSLHHHRGLEWYGHHFDAATADQYCGEVTPYYLFHPLAAERIAAALPDVKLIVLLRDPVERALSQYFHSRRLGLEDLPLEQALEAEVVRLSSGELVHVQEHSYVSRSRYLDQLDRYLNLYPEQQMLVLQSETFFANPAPAWRRIEAFLGLPLAPCPAGHAKANAGRGEAATVSDAVRSLLRQQLRTTALEVRRRYGFGWSWA